MKFSTSTLALCGLLAGSVMSMPTATLDKKASLCGQWDSVTTGQYILYNDLWNEAEGTGSQCISVTSVSGISLAWTATWSWADNSNQVKSYANAVLNTGSKQLSTITSIPAIWKWSYSGSGITADVSWDMFLSTTSGGSSSYEIMVWLAAIGGAGPISSTGSPIATLTVGGVTFNLYSGPNGSTTVYSFVATTEATNFSGNLMTFFKYLETNEGVSSSLYLTSLGAGTEPFIGSNAVFTVSQYAVSIGS